MHTLGFKSPISAFVSHVLVKVFSNSKWQFGLETYIIHSPGNQIAGLIYYQQSMNSPLGFYQSGSVMVTDFFVHVEAIILVGVLVHVTLKLP